MSKLVQFDFNFAGPFGEELTNALAGLAQSINQEPGFIWKIRTENAQTGKAAASTYSPTKRPPGLTSANIPSASKPSPLGGERQNLRHQ